VVGWPNYRNDIVGLHFAGSTGNPFFPDGAFGIANPIFAVLDQLNVEVCRPPKGKESKDKEKEREKDGLDPVGAPGIMKEKDRDLLGSQSALHQKVSAEAQLLSELVACCSSLVSVCRGIIGHAEPCADVAAG
jgi:hypothetical protein